MLRRRRLMRRWVASKVASACKKRQDGHRVCVVVDLQIELSLFHMNQEDIPHGSREDLICISEPVGACTVRVLCSCMPNGCV